ncbi:MAG: hypothetical protein IPQ23_11370 [Cytophagaceae bacterium]|nr:hypothetical protein [Cytophagaceae bacterium]
MLLKNFFLEYSLEKNKIKLSDLMRISVFNENEDLFSKLDYNDDKIFLEPSLFCYFLSEIDKRRKLSLYQIFFGYFAANFKPLKVEVKSDVNGLVNLPNIGYIQLNPNSTEIVELEDIENKHVKDIFIKKSQIRLCLHLTEHLEYQNNNIFFNESVNTSLVKNIESLNDAVSFFQEKMPYFWEAIETCTRELVLFSGKNINSFAGIQNHGTAYINVENSEKSVVFFIDEIAHQCGHIIFNVLTLDTENFLKVEKNFPISNIISNSFENRTAYGAFHGLFTYTTILLSLDSFLENNTDSLLTFEAKGRLGFYFCKFQYDLNLFKNSKLLTDQGCDLRIQFENTCLFIQNKWLSSISNFRYHNQSYNFQFDLFEDLNTGN